MTKSIHNIYPEYSDNVVERWVKATIGAVAGKRIDPYTDNSRIDFLLMSREEDFDVATRKLTFNYETEVIELYTAREATLFRSLNKPAIEAGLLKPYEQEAPKVNDTNVFTDTELQTILNMSNIVSYKKALRSITAVAVLERMEKLVTDDHRQWILKELIKRKEMIQNA
jgi:hypothetical protein